MGKCGDGRCLQRGWLQSKFLPVHASACGQGHPFPHTHRGAKGQTGRQTDRQADCQLIFCFSSRLFTLRVTVAAASSRGPRAAKFWQTLQKNSKVLLASLRAASHPDKGDRGAGLGQSGAPRTHSATELPWGGEGKATLQTNARTHKHRHRLAQTRAARWQAKSGTLLPQCRPTRPSNFFFFSRRRRKKTKSLF